MENDEFWEIIKDIEANSHDLSSREVAQLLFNTGMRMDDPEFGGYRYNRKTKVRNVQRKVQR